MASVLIYRQKHPQLDGIITIRMVGMKISSQLDSNNNRIFLCYLCCLHSGIGIVNPNRLDYHV